MARNDLQKLSEELLATRLNFVTRGEHELEAIYDAVKTKYPHLCDDTYLCSDNCSSGQKRPEWRHTVRTVLSRLKGSSKDILRGERRGRWRLI
jgi:hypothetical protein